MDLHGRGSLRAGPLATTIVSVTSIRRASSSYCLRIAVARSAFQPRPNHSSTNCLVRRQRVQASFSQRPAESSSSGAMSPNREEVLASSGINQDLRGKVEAAVVKQGFRVTVGDVAAAAGVDVAHAEDAVRALAMDSLATLQVSAQGDILYVFPQNFKDVIRSKSLAMRLEPLAKGAVQVAAYFARVAFGTALITSVVTVYMAIVVISSSNTRDDRSRDRGYGVSPMRLWFSATDLFWFYDPFYYQRRRQWGGSSPEEGLTFLEAVFSFVFGDGDPNQDFEMQRWEAIGRYIQYRGGVVVAEELAPFLDITPELVTRRSAMVVNESFMLPVLRRFKGQAGVDAAGNILYSFPELQPTAKAKSKKPKESVALEKLWKLTEASQGQQLATIVLGLANLVGILFLGTLLQSPANQFTLARNGLAWVQGTLPLLQIYAGAFFFIPLMRFFGIRAQNAAIEQRNDARLHSLRQLQNPTPSLRGKLESATLQGSRKVIKDSDVVFRSDKALEEQPIDLEAISFEERLERRARERERQR